MEIGTKFIGIKPGVDTIERKSAQANSPTDVYTVEEIRGFNTYAGMIDTSIIEISDESLVEGNEYIIKVNDGSGDFTNVGAADNNVGTSFVATGTTPTDWGTPAAVLIDVDNSSASINPFFNSLGFDPEMKLDLVTNYPDIICGFDFPAELTVSNFIINLPAYIDTYVYAANNASFNVSVISKNSLAKQAIQLTLY